MGRHHKLAAAVAVALLLGAASPALAAPGKGKALGHTHKPAKPTPPSKKGPKPKKPKQSHLNGGGTTSTNGGTATAGEFSVQVKADKFRQGHFNFTATDVKVRCRGFEPGDVTFTGTATPATVTFDTVKCSITRADGVRHDATMSGTMTDAGKPADTTPPTPGPDSVNLTVTDSVGTVTIAGPVTGNIKVH